VQTNRATRFRRALHADAIHAVVPVAGAHERQSVGAEGQAVTKGAHAVIVERPRLVGLRRLAVVVVLPGLSNGPQVGRGFVEDRGIAVTAT